MIRINSNGSKWAGQKPDSIETLLSVLAETPLDRTFEAYGNFVIQPKGDETETRFFGNFFTLSHVFSIDTDEPEIIAQLTSAIRANQQRPDYLAQQTPEEAEREEAEAEEKRQAAIAKKRREEAKAVLGLI